MKYVMWLRVYELGPWYIGRRVDYQMEHDRQMALKAEAEKEATRKNKSQLQRDALHEQMREREELQREVCVCVEEGENARLWF